MIKNKNNTRFRARGQWVHWLVTVFFLITCFQNVPGMEVMTLDKALNYAFRNSPSIQQAGYSLEISERNLMAQQAGLKSQFNLTVTPYSYSSQRVFNDLISQYNTQELSKTETRFSITQPIKWTDGTLSIVERFNWQESSSSYAGPEKLSYFSNSIYISFNQPLFTYNKTKLMLQELELALENAQLNYAIQKLVIESQVTQQFLNLYSNRRSIQIAEQEYQNADESYQIIKSKVDAGISAPGELYQADLNRANSRASLENKQIQFQNALDSFKILIGVPLGMDLEIVTDIRKSLVEIDFAKAIEHGLSHRMELRQRDINIQNALDDLVVAAAENEFKASIDVSFGFTGTNKSFSDIYTSPNTDKLFAVSLNLPLFDWGKRKHRIAASNAQVEIRKLSAREEKKQIEYEIRQAYRDLQNQKTQIEIAEKNIVNAQLTYEINLELYKSGDLSSKDLQFYQLQLSAQQLGEVEALINYKIALLEMKIRTLWDFEKNVSIIEIK